MTARTIIDLRGRAWNADGRLFLIVTLGAMLAVRLIYCLNAVLLPEEAYYWNYAFARHLDIGYFDHPPMVAWLIRSCTAVLGNTEIGVRCGALLCSIVTSCFVYGLTQNLFGARAARFAVVLAQILPFFFLAGVLMTPDAALTAAWAASLYFFERALLGERRIAWAAVGVSLGLGLLSKYTIALLGVSVLVFMLLDSRSRPWLRRWEPYAAVVLASALFAPVIVWNMNHDWASFTFQTVHRLEDRPQFALHKLIASALILMTPIGLWAAAAALGDRPVQTPAPKNFPEAAALAARRWLFLRLTTLVPLSVFALFSLRHEVKLDWTGVVWLAALPAIAACKVATDSATTRFSQRALNGLWAPTLGILVVGYCIGVHALATGIPSASLAKQPELIPIGWRDLADQVSRIAQHITTEDGTVLIIVGMDRYAIASELAFYAHDQLRANSSTTTAHLFGGVGLMYELWFPKAQLKGRDLLLVAWKSKEVDGPQLAAFARDMGPVQTGSVSRDGKAFRTFYYRVIRGYRDVPTAVD